MKRTLIVVLALTACLFTSNAFAGLFADTYTDDARAYLTLSGGATQMVAAGISDPGGADRITAQPGYNVMIATGLAWDVGRLEFSGGYNYQDFDEQRLNGVNAPLDGRLKVYNLLMSVFFDFNKDGMMSPYFGGGIGGARLDIRSDDLAGNDAFTFAYQLGLGLTLNTSDNFVIDVGYRLLGTNNVDFGQTSADYLLFNNVNVGLRWLF